MTGRATPTKEELARALVLIHRYSVDITAIAAQALGDEAMENRDIQLVMTLSRAGRLTPTELTGLMAAPRSTVARAMNRSEAAGLTVRRPDLRDGRSVRVDLTARGRRRVRDFATRLGDYFTQGEPLLKELLPLLGAPLPEQDPGAPADPLTAAAAMSSAGAEFVAAVVAALEPYGLREFSERFTLALLGLHGQQRPSALADELGLRPSGLSGVLTRMEAVAVITRRHDLALGDRRGVVVALTPRGYEAFLVELEVFARHAEQLAAALARTMRS